jgi:alanyl-tRNA synthetase
LGYTDLEAQSDVLLLVKEGQEVAQAERGDRVEVVTAATPFYGESGGQVGDQGVIRTEKLTLAVEDTIKDPAGLIIHRGKVTSGQIAKGDTVRLRVDRLKRQQTALNHTATHILHGALRHVLGDHVKQAGSRVAPDGLRFDFTHFAQVSAEEINQIETMVNARIRENVPVATSEMDAQQAMQSGAMALFEEKYGERVRVVSLSDFSKELCGGTHTERTGDIGHFIIVAETSVGAGVRRIEALTGPEALAYVQSLAHTMQQSSHMLKCKPDGMVDRIQQLIRGNKSSEKEIEKLKAALADAKAGGGGQEARDIHGVAVMIRKVAVDKPAALRDLADRFKDRLASGIVVLGAESGGKALLIAVVTKDLVKRFHAGQIIKQVAAMVGGGGGGRPDMAQAGGTQPDKLDLALEKAVEIITEMGVS